MSNSNELKQKAIFYATQSKDNAIHYQHSEIGYNYRMSNICAGIGLGQIKTLEQNITARRNNHSFYKNLFKSIQAVELFETKNEDYFSNYWLTTILVNSDQAKYSNYTLMKAFEEKDIETRPIWKPMHLQPVFEKYPYYGNKVSEKLFECGLCLPSGSNLTDEDKDRIGNVVKTFFNK